MNETSASFDKIDHLMLNRFLSIPTDVSLDRDSSALRTDFPHKIIDLIDKSVNVSVQFVRLHSLHKINDDVIIMSVEKMSDTMM